MDTAYRKVFISSLGYEIPPERLTSEEIEAMLAPAYARLNLPEGRLEMMTGIRERRLWARGTKPSDAAAMAGRRALENSPVARHDIGCMLMCSVCRDFLEPATATVVHNALGLPDDCLVFDISNACLGILTGMVLVANMIEAGQIGAGMLVAGENSRPLIESTIAEINGNLKLTRKTVKPYFSSLTIGSGAVAFILSGEGSCKGGHRLVGGSVLAATRHNALCRGNEDKGMDDNLQTLMSTDSELLMHKGVEVAAETWKKFKAATGWNEHTPDLVCTHQVGKAHKKMLLEALGIPREKDYETIEDFGNTGSVSCPLTLALAADRGMVKGGDRIALLGIGSGINCTMLGVEW